MDSALLESVTLLTSRAAAHRIGIDVRSLGKLAEEAGVVPFAELRGLRTSRRSRRWSTCAWEPEVVAFLASWVKARGGMR